jgi:hypothetical protein
MQKKKTYLSLMTISSPFKSCSRAQKADLEDSLHNINCGEYVVFVIWLLNGKADQTYIYFDLVPLDPSGNTVPLGLGGLDGMRQRE